MGAKAAPGYFLAKRIIRLIEGIASVVNADTRVNGWMRVAFVPDYRVSLAETLIPAADLSEQISTAGSEASGTGNMKFAINGALTIGTLDGATIEMRDEIGAENIFVFGHTAEQVAALKAEGAYDPKDWLARQSRLARVLDAIAADRFAEGEPGVDRPILEALLEQGDRYLLVADFADYADTEEHVEHAFIEPRSWQRKCLLNIARMGYFSSDRTILEYARDIWGLRA